MNAKASSNLEFAPPTPPGAGRAWVVAGIAHALLFIALGLATAWKTQPQTAQAEAELWSAVPQAAAPQLQEPPPEPAPEPAPTPQPVKPAPPPPPAPDPAQERLDAQIALEKKKQEEKKKSDKLKADKEKAEKEAKAKAEKTKAEKDKAEKEKANKDKLAKEKAAKDAKEKEAKEREKKKAAEKAAAESKADAARTEAMRQENLKRMQGMAGASGGEKATGTALKASGPSASYAGRLVGSIKPNIIYPGDVVGNPRAEVEVRVAEDGTIQKITLVQKSGNTAWDEAVLRAIEKTKKLPKDSDGRIPPVIVLGFRPLD